MGKSRVAKRGGISCLCHTGTQAAQPVAVPVSARTCWDVLDDASGPAALLVQPEELFGKAAAPVQPLHVSFLGVRRELAHWYGC